MKVLFLTNYPSPYRVDFFNLLGQQVDLTVAFTEKPEEQKHRSSEWFNRDYSGFHAVFLNDRIRIGGITVCRDVFTLLKENFNYIILGGYSGGTQMAAIEYMRLHKIPFAIEADGGLISKESRILYWIKKHLIGSASTWFSSGKTTSDYFIHYGAASKRIITYPFTSQSEKDVEDAGRSEEKDKEGLLKSLDIREQRMVLSVGQMIPRKGIDVLLKAAQKLPDDLAVLIIGGTPTNELLSLKKELKLDHVYFEEFKVKQELARYYRAAELLVMPTREDIWGLVINEAMSFGLPVVSTDRCVAALELVENDVNGMIVPSDNPDALAAGILHVLESDRKAMRHQSLLKIQDYTIENMVEAHMRFFKRINN